MAMKWQFKNLGVPAYLTLIFLFFYIPIIILIVYSFNEARYSLIWHGATLRWYRELFANQNLWLAAWHSLVLGILSSTGAVMIGTFAAICLYRYRFFGRQLLYGVLFILILSPEIVMGIALLLLFTMIKMPLGFTTLLLAHTTFCVPFVAVTAYSRLVSFNKDIFEAAKDLGATDWITFTRITLPLLWPALLAGWLLSFTLSIDDVMISYFVAGPEFEILPLKIYSMVRIGIKPEINALCTVLFCVTLSFIVLYQSLIRKKT